MAAPGIKAANQSVIFLYLLRTVGNIIIMRIKNVTMSNERLMGRVKKIEGSPSETCNARRKFSSTIGPNTNPSIKGTGLKSRMRHITPKILKITKR